MMKIRNLAIVFSLIIGSFYACTNPKEHKNGEEHKTSHWTYKGEEGPENWANLSGDFKACAGQVQSPIDISGAELDSSLEPITVNYDSSLLHIVNNGHTVQFNVDSGSTITVNGTQYSLLQFHYHGLSEHTVEGQHFPLEVHFVHKANDKDYAVIGIFFEEGEENPLFSEFLTHFPKDVGDFTANVNIDLKSLLPEDLSYYNYKGSLTTPPCSEIVNWYVLKHHLTASAEQIKEFQAILDNNYRPVQDLNGRKVMATE